MNGCTIKESNSVIFVSAALLSGVQLLTERIYSPRSKFFPSGVDPFLERLRPVEKQTESHEDRSLLKKIMAKKMAVYAYSSACL